MKDQKNGLKAYNYVYKRHTLDSETSKLKVKDWKKQYWANSNLKTGGVAPLISAKCMLRPELLEAKTDIL